MTTVVYRARSSQELGEVMAVLRARGLSPTAVEPRDPAGAADGAGPAANPAEGEVSVAVPAAEAERARLALETWQILRSRQWWKLLRPWVRRAGLAAMVAVGLMTGLALAMPGQILAIGLFVPVGVAVLVVGIAFVRTVHLDWRIARNRARRQAGLCQRCAYDLRGNLSGRCPECGEESPAGGAT